MAALPPAHALPNNPIQDPADPDHVELNQYLADSTTWRDGCLAELHVYQPNHGFNLALPPRSAANASQVLRLQRYMDLQVHNLTLNGVYDPARTAFTALFAAPAAPAPQAPLHAPRAPKTRMPEIFTGKTTVSAWHFIRQCTNYATIAPFADAEQEIRWMLQLMDGEAAQWRDEMQDDFNQNPAPAHLNSVDDFIDKFKARWMDPHEDEKALDRIMTGKITQTTSVKRYNDAFNDALRLTNEDPANAFVVQAYEAGLKPAVTNTAIAPLLANPRMTLHEKQAMMVRIDKSLMKTRAQTSAPPPHRYVINNPVINVPAATAPAHQARTSATPAPGNPGNPIKVEAACQYTHLTEAERENLRRQGGCFRCRQVGHMANQCPRRPQVAAVEVAVAAPVTPVPDAPAPAMDSAPASDF